MVVRARKKTVADDVVAVMSEDDGWGSNASDAAHFAILEQQAEQAAEIEVQRKHTDKVLEIYAKGQVPSLRRKLHVSDIIGRSICPRKMVLLHCYEQNPIWHSARLSARFETGNAIHYRWQDNIARALDEWEVVVEGDHEETYWNLVFHPDIIAPYEWEDGKPEPTIWELKGYNSREFDRLLGRKDRFDHTTKPRKLPKDAILQNNIYQWFTGVHRGLVVVENKDTQEVWVWPVPYDEELVRPYIPIFDQIKRDIDFHRAHPLKLPPRLDACTSPEDSTPKGCGACCSCFAGHQERMNMRIPESWDDKENK